jgi:hypothetical protein
MAAEVGVKITGDVSSALAALDKLGNSARSSFSGIEGAFGSLTGVLKGFAAPIAAFTAALGGGAIFKDSIQETLKFGAEIARLGRVMGTTRAESTVLSIAIGDIYGDVDTFLAGMTKMVGVLGKSEAAIQKLGIATRDARGEFLPMTTLIPQINTVLATYAEGIDRDLAAKAIYGKSWESMLKYIALTPEVMEAARVKTQALNLVMGTNAQTNLKNYKAAMNDVGDVMLAFKLRLGNEVLPTLTAFGEWFSKVGPGALNWFFTTLDALAGPLIAVTAGLVGLTISATITSITVGGMSAAFVAAKAALISFYAATGPLGWAVAIIAALGASIFYLIGASQKAQQAAMEHAKSTRAVALAALDLDDKYKNVSKSLAEGNLTVGQRITAERQLREELVKLQKEGSGYLRGVELQKLALEGLLLLQKKVSAGAQTELEDLRKTTLARISSIKVTLAELEAKTAPPKDAANHPGAAMARAITSSMYYSIRIGNLRKDLQGLEAQMGGLAPKLELPSVMLQEAKDNAIAIEKLVASRKVLAESKEKQNAKDAEAYAQQGRQLEGLRARQKELADQGIVAPGKKIEESVPGKNRYAEEAAKLEKERLSYAILVTLEDERQKDLAIAKAKIAEESAKIAGDKDILPGQKTELLAKAAENGRLAVLQVNSKYDKLQVTAEKKLAEDVAAVNFTALGKQRADAIKAFEGLQKDAEKAGKTKTVAEWDALKKQMIDKALGYDQLAAQAQDADDRLRLQRLENARAADAELAAQGKISKDMALAQELGYVFESATIRADILERQMDQLKKEEPLDKLKIEKLTQERDLLIEIAKQGRDILITKIEAESGPLSPFAKEMVGQGLPQTSKELKRPPQQVRAEEDLSNLLPKMAESPQLAGAKQGITDFIVSTKTSFQGWASIVSSALSSVADSIGNTFMMMLQGGAGMNEKLKAIATDLANSIISNIVKQEAAEAVAWATGKARVAEKVATKSAMSLQEEGWSLASIARTAREWAVSAAHWAWDKMQSAWKFANRAAHKAADAAVWVWEQGVNAAKMVWKGLQWAWDKMTSAWNTAETAKTVVEEGTKTGAKTASGAAGIFASWTAIGPWGYAIAAALVIAMLAVMSSVKGRAVGGLVTGPELTMLGEKGPELVAPEHDFKDWANSLQSGSYNLGANIARAQAQTSGYGQMGSSYAQVAKEQAHVAPPPSGPMLSNVNIFTNNSSEMQAFLAKANQGYQRRNG